MDFIIASNNEHKINEFKRILSPLGISVISLKEADIKIEIEETGLTFEENAYLKAKTVCEISQKPTIADDSGICVDFLSGDPGIYSARYGGENTNDKINNEKLLKNLQNVPKEKRKAHFTCSICCLFPDGEKITAEEKCNGYITEKACGENGFGYDVIFSQDSVGCFGLLSAEIKDKISHRGKALRSLYEKLNEKIKE